KAEDGMIDPIKYANLQETSTDDYSQRTEYNVRDSDGTLIMIIGNEDIMDNGTKLTVNMTKKYQKPMCIISLNEEHQNINEMKILEWLMINKIQILNIAGLREQTIPGIYQQTQSFLRNLLPKTFN
ncbi:unnamed protein product, partial [Adineta steineri]